jgi:DNA processing protein
MYYIELYRVVFIFALWYKTKMTSELQYKIGITLIDGVGDINAKNLIAYCGSPEAVFKQKKDHLLKIPGIGENTAASIVKQDVLKRAEEEIIFIEKNNVTTLFYLDKEYPLRLKQCADSPVMIYYKGAADLNTNRIIAIVGTRNITDYGKKITQELVNGLKNSGALIVSGLAYGVDSAAHRAALGAGMATVGVVAHGLDQLYPPENYNMAQKMLDNGGILTEFLSNTEVIPANFPKRNRVIAGLSDAVVIVESKETGGAMITAEIAFSYNREVMAFPGKTEDVCSQGCNRLIQQNKAYLIRSSTDVLEYLQWQKEIEHTTAQQELLLDLSPEEETIVSTLKAHKSPMYIDDLAIQSKLTPGILSSHLLTLEFAGVLKSLPGKMYSL